MSPILKCEKLTKRFGENVALNELDLELSPGRIVGLFGKEGSGKTTLLKLAAGLLTPDGGSVLVNGFAPGAGSKRIAAFLPSEEAFDDRASVRDLLRFYGDFYADFDRESAVSAVYGLGMEAKEKLSELSKGSLTKLRVLLTMCRAAKLYLLDDPARGVDTATLSFVLDTVVSRRAEGSCVVISSRAPSDVERIIDDAVFISAGRITLFEDAEKLRAEKGRSVHTLFTEEFKC